MADTKLIGNNFFLRFEDGGNEVFIVCEQNSEWSASSETITVLCKTTGDWAETLAGGTNSASLSFTGAYVKDPSGDDISAFGLAELLGTVQDFTWGGIADGDDAIEFKGKVSDISISANTNEAITFSATITVSDEPTYITVTT